jgi:hypothetical protein
MLSRMWLCSLQLVSGVATGRGCAGVVVDIGPNMKEHARFWEKSGVVLQEYHPGTRKYHTNIRQVSFGYKRISTKYHLRIARPVKKVVACCGTCIWSPRLMTRTPGVGVTFTH